MRINPPEKFRGMPCSYVGTGCAYENIFQSPFPGPLPDGLKEDGYLPLKKMDVYIRQFLPIKKKIYFNRKQRVPLKKFIDQVKQPICICVYGHFIYAHNGDYMSFFDNEEDPVVCVWYIQTDKE